MDPAPVTAISHFCPRCQAPVNCTAGTDQQCACTQVSLSHPTLEFLRSTALGCLCNSCLRMYEDWVTEAKQPASSTPVEGIDYYLEDNRWVFTEIYHIRRGYCCQSGCRHCPYGNSSVVP